MTNTTNEQLISTSKYIIHIHRPELTDEERAKRMNAIKEAAIRLILAAAQNKGGHHE